MINTSNKIIVLKSNQNLKNVDNTKIIDFYIIGCGTIIIIKLPCVHASYFLETLEITYP